MNPNWEREADRLSSHVYEATRNMPPWQPLLMAVVYTLVDGHKIRCAFLIWGHSPWNRLNRLSGWFTAHWCELQVQWHFIVRYATILEKIVGCLLVANAVKWWLT